MDESVKISLTALVLGFREPTSGKEKHFLKVIKNEARACTPEEKDWFEWYQGTQFFGRKSVVNKNTTPSKKANNSASKNTYEPSQHSHLTEEQKAAILDARKNKERDKNPNLIKKPHYSNQEASKRRIDSDDSRLCINCGKYIPIGRNDPRCVPCKTLYEKSHDTRPKIDEGISGTREANKKMNARQWGEMVNRGKGK